MYTVLYLHTAKVLSSTHLLTLIEKQEINFTKGGGMDSSRLLHTYTCLGLASSSGHAQILSCSCEKKIGRRPGIIDTSWVQNGGLS